MAAAKKVVARQAKAKQEPKAKPSSSAAIAVALEMHFPGKAEQVIKVMADAAKMSRSWGRRLARVQQALANLQKEGQS